jgi:flagellar basal-body rod modification protein FlgD
MTSTSATTYSSNSVLNAYLNQQAQQMAANQAAAASGTGSSNNSLAQAISASTIGSNFNTFINILTTQLKSQDPTNASDPNQFTQELVQFAGVEQQLNTNNDLQTIINLQKNSSGASSAIGYMGQYVQAPVTNGEIPLQNSKAELGYNLGTAAANVKVAVEDANGNTLTTITGAANKGMNYITWDGKDSGGTQMPDGTYKFVVTATNTDGTTQTPTSTEVIGVVTGIASNSDGSTSLTLSSGMTVNTSAVDAIYSTLSLPAATTVPTS